MKVGRVVVRRSVWRVLVVALAGVPLLFLVADYLWGTFGALERLGAWAYRGNDPEPFEVRDDILVAIIALVGSFMVGFGLKELLVPRKVFEASRAGVRLRLAGPFRRPTAIPWTSIRDLEAEPHRLVLRLSSPEGIPADPWGARWRDPSTLVVATRWWGRSPEWAIDRIAVDRLPDEARALQEERLLEEARIHAAAIEVISGKAVVADPTVDIDPVGAVGARHRAPGTTEDGARHRAHPRAEETHEDDPGAGRPAPEEETTNPPATDGGWSDPSAPGPDDSPPGDSDGPAR